MNHLGIKSRNDRSCDLAVESLVRRMNSKMMAIRGKLLDVDYPFDYGDDNLSIGEWLLREPPTLANFIAETIQSAPDVLELFFWLRSRTLAKLATMCEWIEAELGFEVIEAPDFRA